MASGLCSGPSWEAYQTRSSYGSRAEVSDALKFHPWTGLLAKKNNLRPVKLIRFYAIDRYFENESTRTVVLPVDRLLQNRKPFI